MRAGRSGAGRTAPGRTAGRAFRLGFLVGALVTLPAIVLALLVPVGERLQPFLTPGAELLRLLPLPTATWPGALTLLLAALANGLVVGALAAAVAAVVVRWRAGRAPHQAAGR